MRHEELKERFFFVQSSEHTIEDDRYVLKNPNCPKACVSISDTFGARRYCATVDIGKHGIMHETFSTLHIAMARTIEMDERFYDYID